MAGHGTSIEGMLTTAREALPGSTIPRLLLSEKPGDPIFIYQRFPEDKTPAGRSFTTLDSEDRSCPQRWIDKNSARPANCSRSMDKGDSHRYDSGPADSDFSRLFRAFALRPRRHRTGNLDT
jgi:hypothetical protein